MPVTIEQLQAKQAELEKLRQEYKAAVASIEAMLSETKKAVEEAKARLDQATAAFNASPVAKQVNSLKAQLAQAEQAVASSPEAKAVAAAQAQYDKARQELDAKRAELGLKKTRTGGGGGGRGRPSNTKITLQGNDVVIEAYGKLLRVAISEAKASPRNVAKKVLGDLADNNKTYALANRIANAVA